MLPDFFLSLSYSGLYLLVCNATSMWTPTMPLQRRRKRRDSSISSFTQILLNSLDKNACRESRTGWLSVANLKAHLKFDFPAG